MPAEEKPILVDPVGDVNYENVTGGGLTKGRLIRKTGVNTINHGNWDSLSEAAIVGVLKADAANGATDAKAYRPGDYIPSGVIESDDFIEGSLPSEGTWVYLGSADGKFTVTPPSNGSGKAQVFLGIWNRGGLDFTIVPWGIA